MASVPQEAFASEPEIFDAEYLDFIDWLGYWSDLGWDLYPGLGNWDEHHPVLLPEPTGFDRSWWSRQNVDGFWVESEVRP